jgi:hypothetical protein
MAFLWYFPVVIVSQESEAKFVHEAQISGLYLCHALTLYSLQVRIKYVVKISAQGWAGG